AVCIENWSGKPNFSTGDGGAIQDLGYYPGGFSDPSFVKAPELATDSLINDGGYSLEGQSIVLEENHIYVVVEASGDDASDNYYHYVYVSNIGADSASVDFDMTIRVGQKAADR